MTPLKCEDLKAGMIVALKDGRTGRIESILLDRIGIKWPWDDEVFYVRKDLSPNLYQPNEDCIILPKY